MVINHLVEAINLAVRTQTRFCAYKEPGNCEATFFSQTDENFTSDSGFKIKTFTSQNDYSGEYYIYPQHCVDSFLRLHLSPGSRNSVLQFNIPSSTTRHQYNTAIHKCLSLLKRRVLDKIVLSKVIAFSTPNVNWGQLFVDLLYSYPDAFNFIYFTPETGGWAGATPEILGIFTDGNFKTMALAATRRTGETRQWSEKEFREQEIVVQYIADTFIKADIPYSVSQKCTHKAGNVEHLCNYFESNDNDLKTAEFLIDTLHPTPAVCGIPKDNAINALSDIEQHKRGCYGGYIGPFSKNSFAYYVNLRSLCFDRQNVSLYCGGGIVIDSDPEKEWDETEAKSKTLIPILTKNSGIK